MLDIYSLSLDLKGNDDLMVNSNFSCFGKLGSLKYKKPRLRPTWSLTALSVTHIFNLYLLKTFIKNKIFSFFFFS